MSEKTSKPHSPAPKPTETEEGLLTEECLRLKEYAITAFRDYLSSFLVDRSSGQSADSDQLEVVATGALISVLRMIGEKGECPLSAAQFWRIVGQSSFKKVLCAGEPETQEPTVAVVERWEMRNQRRLALIRRSLSEDLNPAEQADLQQLQAELDNRLESQDDRLLDALRRMKMDAGQLPDEPPNDSGA